MANLPANLPRLLREAGLTVVEIDGWQTRGRPASTGAFAPVGVLNHHTGSSAKLWTKSKRLAYAKWMFITGLSDLPAPLCQLALGRDGTVYLGAAGRANHAGTAKAVGSVAAGDGNKLYIGIEWMLSGTQKIPAKMREAGITLNAVLTEKVTNGGKGTSVETIACHYQTSVSGKWDIGDPDGVPYNGAKVLNVPAFRTQVEIRRQELYRPVPKVEKITVMTANLAGRKEIPALKRVLRDEKPTAVVLSEASRCRKFLGTIKGYKRKQFTKVHGSEAPGIALLFAEGVKTKNRRALKMSVPWIGPLAGIKHDPRVYPSIQFRADTIWTRLLGVHLPTSNNPSAKAESIRRINRWFQAPENDVPSLAPGDYNTEADDLDKVLMAAVAKGTFVDHAGYLGCTHVKTTRLRDDQPEDMHGWVIYTFEIEEKK